MRIIKIIIIALFITFGLFACAASIGKKPVSIAENRSLEASLFRQNCAICHGMEGTGKEVNGKMVPSLREGDALTKTEEQMFIQIRDGGNGMLPFKYQLSEDQIRKMAKFVKKDLQGRD
jgi:mono/diheme cytochrome c family protein